MANRKPIRSAWIPVAITVAVVVIEGFWAWIWNEASFPPGLRTSLTVMLSIAVLVRWGWMGVVRIDARSIYVRRWMPFRSFAISFRQVHVVKRGAEELSIGTESAGNVVLKVPFYQLEPEDLLVRLEHEIVVRARRCTGRDVSGDGGSK